MVAKKPKSAPKSAKKQVPAAAPAPLKDRAVDSALDLAATMGWDMITLTDIADGAGATLAEMAELFDDKTDILVAYGRRLDRLVLESYGAADPSMPEQDRLFEILMERFDLLNRNRAAVVSILKSFTADPKQAVISLPHLGRSMTWTLEAAGLDSAGFRGAARVFGLSVLYMATVREWMSDESEDLSKTMAALDKNLGRAQKFAGTFLL